MKKVSIILIVLLAFVLGACDDSSTSETNEISGADLNEREDTILSTTSDDSFVFDYNIETEYEEVVVWIEKYELGELVDDKLNEITTGTAENEGTIVLARSKAHDDEEKVIYHIGIGDKGGSAYGVATDETFETKEEDFSITSGQLMNGKTIDDGEESALATVAYSDDEFGTTSISNDFYEDPDAHMDELDGYNVVYVLKAEFRK